MYAVEIRLVFPQCVIQLCLKCHVVVKVVSKTERGSSAEEDVIEDAVWIGVDILIAHKRPVTTNLFGKLSVERRHIENEVTGFINVPYREPFIQHLDASRCIYSVKVNDGLAHPYAGTFGKIADLVVVEGATDFQSCYGTRTAEEAEIYVVAIVFVHVVAGVRNLRADGIA